MRYKIRKEVEGAFVFDRLERSLFKLTEDELRILLATEKTKKVSNPKENIREKQFFQNGLPNFFLIEPLMQVRKLPQLNCLAAPNRLYLELTRKCNLRCQMCYNASSYPLQEEMSMCQIISLLDEMDKIGVFEARLTGGEPTQRPDFFKIIDYAINKDFYVSLATNGVWSSKLRKEICLRKIDDVIVSLDGPEEINDNFRKGGSFKTTIKSINELKNSGIKKIRINTVISRVNWQHVEPLFQICETYDLLLINFIHPRPFGRGAIRETKNKMLSAYETLRFNRLVEKLRQKHPNIKVVMDFDLLSKEEPMRHQIVPRIMACPAGREFAFISPQGFVFPCGVAPVQDVHLLSPEEKRLFVAGNILEESLLKIWYQSPVWEKYRDLSKCKPKKCFSCKFWGKRCFGTCPIGAYYHSGALNGEDPYCYSHLL